MATLESPLGRINQSFGGMTATKWKNKTVLKQKVPSTNTSKSPAQTLQRRKFAFLAALGGKYGPGVRVGFRTVATDDTEQNQFTSRNFDLVTDNGTVSTIDYLLVSISTGIVGPLSGLVGDYNGITGNIDVQWDDNSNGTDALPTDLIQVLVYDKVTKTAYWTPGLSNRAGSPITPTMPAGLTVANLVVYAFFKRASSTATSPSSVVAAT